MEKTSITASKLKLRPNAQRAESAIILLWIVLALEIVMLVSNYFQYSLLQTIASGGYVSDAAANTNDTRVAIIGFLYLFVFVIFLIAFIMWFRRAYFNLHQKVDNLTHSEGWAAGSWFVPFLNLYRPYEIMKEIYVETQKLFRRKGLAEKADYTTDYLGWWWVVWVASAVLGSVSMQIFRNAKTVDNYITSTVLDMILGVLGIVFALITIKVIKDYSKVEPLLNEVNENENDEVATT